MLRIYHGNSSWNEYTVKYPVWFSLYSKHILACLAYIDNQINSITYATNSRILKVIENAEIKVVLFERAFKIISPLYYFFTA